MSDKVLKTMADAIDAVPGNPNRMVGGGARPVRDVTADAGYPGTDNEPRVMTREAPSMATQVQGRALTQSIAQLLCKYAEDIAVFIEQEADRRLAAARADNEKMHQFADSVRRNGIGNL